MSNPNNQVTTNTLAFWSQDEKSLAALSALAWMIKIALAIFVVILIYATIKQGLEYGLLAAFGWGAVYFFLLALLFSIVYKWGIMNIARIMFAARKKDLVNSLSLMKFSPSLSHAWSMPTPGLIAVDIPQKAILAIANDTGYKRALFKPHQITNVKVERETHLHTETKHGGSFGIMSSSGLGYNFGSRSHSKTKVTENIFLEIHYQLQDDSAPGWIAIPYGRNRQAAESMATTILNMKRNA